MKNIILKVLQVYLNFSCSWINNIACYFLRCQKKDSSKQPNQLKLKVLTSQNWQVRKFRIECKKSETKTVNNQDQTTIETVEPLIQMKEVFTDSAGKSNH
jgi:hypothetical protein